MPGMTGITGKLHQQGWNTPMAGESVFATAIDTHWIARGFRLDLFEPSETYGVFDSSEPSDVEGYSILAGTSFGNHLSGTFGTLHDDGRRIRDPSWTFAYLVSQPGETINFNLQIASMMAAEDVDVAFTIPEGLGAGAAAVPEPATLSLLLICGVAVLRNRRR